MSEDLATTYEHVMYGFAFIRLPDGGRKLVDFNGTREEAQKQLNEAAQKVGGVAPDLSLPGMDLADIPVDSEFGRIAADVYNRAFEKDQAAN